METGHLPSRPKSPPRPPRKEAQAQLSLASPELQVVGGLERNLLSARRSWSVRPIDPPWELMRGRELARSSTRGKMTVRTKRVYDPPTEADGRRYLVDRLWPRGLSKEAVPLTGWLKELAPSPELRTWFGHDPARYAVFRNRYRAELLRNTALLDRLVREARQGTVTLVFAARDAEHCNATVLQELLEGRRAPKSERHRTP